MRRANRIGLIFLLTTVTFSQAQKIAIRVINSKTNQVVQGFDSYNPALVWLFDAKGKQILVNMTPETYHQQGGEIHDVQGASTIQISANGYVDCRKEQALSNPRYSVTEILTHGIVTVNKCTSRTVPETPGVIVLFVREPNWFERHSQD
jgi:hypothetical protein